MPAALNALETKVIVWPILQPGHKVRITVACWSSVPVKNAFSLSSDNFATQEIKTSSKLDGPMQMLF